MTSKIAISIINYRTGELTLQCVRSVLEDLGDEDAASFDPERLYHASE